MAKKLDPAPPRTPRPLQVGTFGDDPAALAASQFLTQTNADTAAEGEEELRRGAARQAQDVLDKTAAEEAQRARDAADLARRQTPPSPPSTVDDLDVLDSALPPGDLRKKSLRVTQDAYRFLRRFRRSHRIALTAIVQYALDNLFETVTDGAIATTLRDVGVGLRRPANGAATSVLTVEMPIPLAEHLERLRDDELIAEGAVGGYALDRMIATQTEEHIVAAIRGRGQAQLRRNRAIAPAAANA